MLWTNEQKTTTAITKYDEQFWRNFSHWNEHFANEDYFLMKKVENSHIKIHFLEIVLQPFSNT